MRSASFSLHSHTPQRRPSKHLSRRHSATARVLPGSADCTELPALKSLNTLLNDDVPTVQDFESQIKRFASQLETNSSPHHVAPKHAGSQEGCWNILLLGRTFRELSEQQVVDAVADILELPWGHADSTVAAAKGKRTHVLSKSSDPTAAFAIMDQLRSRGLLVQVTSEQSPIFSTGQRRMDSAMSVDSVTTTATDSSRSPASPPCRRSDEKRRPKGNIRPQGRAKTADVSSAVASVPRDVRNHEEESEYSGDEVPAKVNTEPSGLDVMAEAAEGARRRFKPPMLKAMIEKHHSEIFRHRPEVEDDPSSPSSRTPRTPNPPMLRRMIEKHHTEVFRQRPDAEGRPDADADPSSASWRTPRTSKASATWDTTLEELGINPQSMSHAAREICDIARFWLLGVHWALNQTQDGVPKSAEEIEGDYKISIGTRAEVQLVYRAFRMLDTSQSGRIEKAELNEDGLKLMKSRFKQLKHALEVARREHANAVVFRSHSKRPSVLGRTLTVPVEPPRSRRNSGHLGETGPPRSGRRTVSVAACESQDAASLGKGRRHSDSAVETADPVSPRSCHTPYSSAGVSSLGCERESLTPVEPASPPSRLQRVPTSGCQAGFLTGIALPAWAPMDGIQCEEGLELVSSQAIGKLADKFFRRKSWFSLEDVFRAIWISSTTSDVQTMRTWCKEFAEEERAARVATPPLLQQADLDDLKAVFHHYEEQGTGTISFDRLVELGLIVANEKYDCQKKWDLNGDGVLEIEEFLDMMCPAGYRATKQSRVGMSKDGARIRFDETEGFWRREDCIRFK